MIDWKDNQERKERMGFNIGAIDENENEKIAGVGDPYIQKLLKKDKDLNNLWNNVGSMFEETSSPKKD